MKISHFPDFLPGETVYSAACRCFDRIQFPSHSTIAQHLFGGPYKGGVTDLPSSLDHLIQALPPYHLYTADAIIDQHTLYPLYAPFLPHKRALKLRQQMKSHATFIHSIAGIATSKVPPLSWLKYCPICVDYDRVTYGECYWHRLHQLPGIVVCPIHEVMLENSQFNLLPRKNTPKFCSAEQSIGNVPERLAPTPPCTAQIQLARNAQWLLNQSVSVEGGDIQRRYLALLTDRGLVTATGKVRYAKLKEAILDYYPSGLLEDLGCGLMGPKENWLANWTVMQHPLHHLLLMQFLCNSAEEFFAKPQPSLNPFGNGPWPCLNPLCSHYKERVIRSYSVKQGSQNSPVATFACTCGFTYTRTGPDKDDAAMLRVGRISQYGEIWDHHLTTYWLNKNVSTAQIARLMHSDAETIRRQGARLGLPFAPDIPRRGRRPEIHLDFFEGRRVEYRALWEETFKAYPDSTVEELMRKAHKEHAWLFRHDREWLNKHYPAPDTLARKEQLRQIKIEHLRCNCEQVDADLEVCVRKIAEEMYRKPDFPIQVTRHHLVVQIGRPALLIKSNVAFDVLPLTSQALDEVVETHTAFTWRKLRWAVQNCLDEKVHPYHREFLRLARIGDSTSRRPMIKQLIQIAYCSLGNGIQLSDQMPEVDRAVENKVVNTSDNGEGMASGSLAALCIEKGLMLPGVIVSPRIYEPVPVLLLTVAAVVNGEETCNAITKWCFENEELLRWLGLPKGKIPMYTTLQKIYVKVNVDSFESVLGAWLHENFPLQKNEAFEVKAYTGSTYVPGLRLLRSYQHIASEVVAKLR